MVHQLDNFVSAAFNCILRRKLKYVGGVASIKPTDENHGGTSAAV